ncbi:uncharacterized protein LOC101850260, partial [Aplysia californica]|uniref:Uncharacterized protein LOC101850260 n=1 Tax=Aplysia californica TaxID=6500 RepID=A0ABM1A3P2_APLCA
PPRPSRTTSPRCRPGSPLRLGADSSPGRGRHHHGQGRAGVTGQGHATCSDREGRPEASRSVECRVRQLQEDLSARRTTGCNNEPGKSPGRLDRQGEGHGDGQIEKLKLLVVPGTTPEPLGPDDKTSGRELLASPGDNSSQRRSSSASLCTNMSHVICEESDLRAPYKGVSQTERKHRLIGVSSGSREHSSRRYKKHKKKKKKKK